jgi:hypothetical protein
MRNAKDAFRRKSEHPVSQRCHVLGVRKHELDASASIAAARAMLERIKAVLIVDRLPAHPLFRQFKIVFEIHLPGR